MNTPPPPARAKNLTPKRLVFTLSPDAAKDLRRVAKSGEDYATLERVNEWWMHHGIAFGFKWTTVGDLKFLNCDGEEMGELGWSLGLDPSGATFTAEPEAAEMSEDEARAWMADRYRHSGPITDNDRWTTTEMATAFAAGRDKGFAMNSATVDALEQQLAEAGRMARQAQMLLRDSADLFRMYERHHRAKVPGHSEPGQAGKSTHAALMEKAERNAEIASRIETYLAQAFRWESVGDPRTREERQRDIILAGRCVVIPLERAELADDLDEEERAPIIRRGFTHAGEEAQRFSTNDPGFDPRQFVTINGFMFTPQAELETLRQLLADAMPAIEFVNGLATIDDADLDTFTVGQLRDQARGALGDDGFKRPGTYTEAQRYAATMMVWAHRARDADVLVDMIAVALGLCLWTKDGPF